MEEIKRIDLALLEDYSDEVKQMYSQATTYSEVVVARNAYYEKKQSSKNEVIVVNEAGEDKVATVNQVGKHERGLWTLYLVISVLGLASLTRKVMVNKKISTKKL